MGLFDFLKAFTRRTGGSPTDAASGDHRYLAALRALAKRGGVPVRPATDAELARLAAIGVKEPVLGLFRQAVLASYVDVGVVVHSVETMIAECTRAEPGMIIQPWGAIVIGSTACGDAFALDFRRPDPSGQPPVLLVSHDQDPEPLTRGDLGTATLVAGSLVEFLEGALAERYMDL